MSQARALAATVGTGRACQLEDSLYRPILKSICEGQFSRVVLLPSQQTKTHAEELKQRLTHLQVEVAPLPNADDENDVDACFGHFDNSIRKLIQSGFPPDAIEADFTRGTKAMSAALALAAVRNQIPRLRYVEGDRDPNKQGVVIPGTERVRTVETAIATASRQLDRARDAFQACHFAAVLEILDDDGRGWPDHLLSELHAARSYAKFYSAWDRLDYSTACQEAEQLPDSSQFGCFKPRPQEIAWVTELARDSPKKNSKRPLLPEAFDEMARHARRLMVDLLANGRRRIRQEQFEDANLRAYRIAEMLGQTRLFAHRLDSSYLDPENPAVAQLREELEKEGSRPLESFDFKGRTYLRAGREQTARLLGRLNDPFADQLKQLGPEVNSRNSSILIHGFDRLDQQSLQSLSDTYDRLEKLLREEAPDVANDWLETANFQYRFTDSRGSND